MVVVSVLSCQAQDQLHISHLQPFFAYVYEQQFPGPLNGWNVYEPVEEFKQMVG